MSSNALRPEAWVDLVQRIQAGDPTVGAEIAHRERVFDNIFQIITKADFVPVVTQGGTFTYTTYTLNGFRIGQWVQLNFRCTVTNSPGAGTFTITTPPQFPIDTTDMSPIVGSFWFLRNGGAAAYGQAIAASTTSVNGEADGGTGLMGANSPLVTAAANDQFGYNLQYLTSAQL